MSGPLFRRLLGDRFDALPGPVRALHDRETGAVSIGRGSVRGATSRLIRGLAAALGLPAPADDVEVRVEIVPDGAGEVWTRRFGSRTMRSRLGARNGRLIELLGPAAFEFSLTASPLGLDWTLERFCILGLPLPAAWCAGIVAAERADRERYCFDVRASLPGVGLLVHYRGWLHVGA